MLFSLLIPVIILLILSSAVTKRFKYKIEQSLFLVVCSITMILIIVGLLNLLLLGLIFIYLFTVISLVYILVNKLSYKKIFTPGICGFILVTITFIFISKGCMLFDVDDVVHWSYATKCMYYSNIFYKGLQTMFTPTFNYFITKSSFHFRESSLFVGAWIFIWSCCMLPLGKLEWKDWKRVIVYIFAQYCILGILYGNVRLHIDESMGYMGAAIATYVAINKKKTAKDYVLILIGLLALTQIKDSFGAVMSMLSAIFIIVFEVINNFGNLKKFVGILSIIFITPILGYMISTMTLDKPLGYLATKNIYNLPIFNLIIQSKITLLFLSITLLMAILFIIFIFNNEAKLKFKKINLNLYILFGALTIVFALPALYKISSLYLSTFSYQGRMDFLNAWKDFFYHTYSGLTNKYLIGLIAVVMGAASIFFINKKDKKVHGVQSVLVIGIVLFYVILVLVAFAAGFGRSGQYSKCISWERYLSTGIVFMLSYVIAYYFVSNDIYINVKYRNILIVAIFAIVIRYLPYPGILLNSKAEPERYGPSHFTEMFMKDSNIIKNNVSIHDKVYIVSLQNNENKEETMIGYYPNIYIKYGIAPIQSNWMYNEDYSNIYDIKGSVKEYKNKLKIYNYIYIHSANEDYYEKYNSIFPKQKFYQKTLYKIDTTDNNDLLLTEVYTE